MHHFGKRLRRLRGKRSQREVADELRIPQTTLSTLENQESAPRGEVVEKLAAYYSVDVVYFYPPSSPSSSGEAKAWLESLADTKFESAQIATQATLPLDPAVKAKIAERIRNERAKGSNRSQDRR